MDSKGILSIDFIFTIFLSLIIICFGLSLIGNNFDDEIIMEEELNARVVVDNIANSINQVNSNNLGNIKVITIPKNISKKSFFITVKRNGVLIVFGNRRGESTIFPTRLANSNKDIVNEINLYSGNSYKIQKSLGNDNLDIIQIYMV